MIKNIERVLFWFQDKDAMLVNLNERFFCQGILMKNLMNEIYQGKKMKFVNIYFSSAETYILYDKLPKNTPYYHGGNLMYYGCIDFEEFNQLDESTQNEFIWEKASQYLIECSNFTKNKELLEASKYALKKGIEIDLNCDYRLLETNVVFNGENLKASVWVNFYKDHMTSKFTLERDANIIFEKNIDRTKNGVEFFLEMYKKIEVEGDFIIVKGHKDVDYFPLKFSLNEIGTFLNS